MTVINQRWQSQVPQIVGRDPGDYARALQTYLESLDAVLTAVNVILGAFSVELEADVPVEPAVAGGNVNAGIFLLMGA